AVEAVELLHHGAHRHPPVVPCVAVGDREDVEVVHLLAPRIQRRVRPAHHATEPLNAGISHPAVNLVQAALTTLFDLRQRMQTYTRRLVSPSCARTFCRFGWKRGLVATSEWLREFPKAGFLPQLWQ